MKINKKFCFLLLFKRLSNYICLCILDFIKSDSFVINDYKYLEELRNYKEWLDERKRFTFFYKV